ncbi:recombinase family protein [Enterocloster lavalensis]|uniref:recombinase family protein n=1 Tax=Enterocloster lavalensis TaxID=460384 RepID=UPI0023F27AD3|nr:recombinase family protein [Enterocloster lavalensis]
MKNYTICAYMRLSDEDEDIFGRKVESGSITSQRRLIMDFINSQPEFRGCKMIERCDDGLSGRYFDTRPQFMDMIEQTKKGKINCIIVKDCSRFGRDYVELGDYLEQIFPFLGVRFIAINDHYDSDKCEGGLDIAFKNLVYDIYSRELSKKVRESRRQMAQQGKYTACQTLYGYRKMKKDKHKLEKDPEAAAIVREIFDMRLAGMGLTDIARNLNDRGIQCRIAYKHDKGDLVNHAGRLDSMCWTSGSVYQLLSNDIYTGAVVSLKMEFDRLAGKQKQRPKEEWIRVEGMHEAIVSKEEFRQVQDMFQLQAPTSPFKKQHYRCGICGRRLNRRNGEDLYCARGYFLKEECECRVVKSKESYLDKIILKDLKIKMQRVMDAEKLKLKSNADRVSGVDALHSLKNALGSAKKAKQILFEKLADRSIDRESFKQKKQIYDTEIAELEQKISDVNMAAQLVRDSEEAAAERIETVESFLEVAEMTEEIWKKFVEDVFLYPGDRMEIHWNFED